MEPILSGELHSRHGQTNISFRVGFYPVPLLLFVFFPFLLFQSRSPFAASVLSVFLLLVNVGSFARGAQRSAALLRDTLRSAPRAGSTPPGPPTPR